MDWMERDQHKYVRYFGKNQETRWADENEIRAITERVILSASTHSAAGLPMLNNGRDAYVDSSDTHSLIFGATGSKKTRLFVMPMLNIMIGAGESFIATDPKGELFDRTSGLAEAQGYRVVVLNYRDLSIGDTWNPLALPYHLYHNGEKDEAVARIADFVNALSADVRANARDPFWINAAASVATAILLYMLEACTEKECNIRTFTRFCIGFAQGGALDPLTLAIYEQNDLEVPTNYLHELMDLAPGDSIARLNYEGIIGSSDKARGDVQSMLFSIIGIFMTQERLVRNMMLNSFDLRSLGREKTALYLIVPDEKTTFHFITTTFIKQCYETLIAEAQAMPDRRLPVRVNFVLDEFANIPPIPDMPAMITAARSRNMRYYLIIQSMHQLDKRYGDEAQTLKGNCENWVFLSSKEIKLLKEISALCGEILTDDQSHRQPLISISHLQRLNKQRGEALIFCGRQYPFITEIADIDDCEFQRYEPVKLKEIPRRTAQSIDPETLHAEIMCGKRAMPFVDAVVRRRRVRKG